MEVAMYYQSIVEMIKTNGCMSTTEIINELKKENETVNVGRVRKVLGKMEDRKLIRETAKVNNRLVNKYKFLELKHNSL